MKIKNYSSVTIRLMSLLGKYFGLVIIATLNGVLGFILAMNITIFGALGILKYIGVYTNISYELIFSIIIISGFLRGALRYFEQYFNHYLAFKLLAFLRAKIFDKLRIMAINRFDQYNKAELVSIIQADVETLEIFYAHTLSPLLIAIITSTIVVIFISILTNIYVGLLFIASYLIIGMVIPYIFYLFNKNYGDKYRKKLSNAKSNIIDSIYGKNEIIMNNKQNLEIIKVNNFTNEINKNSKKLDFNNAIFKNITLMLIIILNLLVILISWILINNGLLINYKLILIFVTLISSFGPVIALANLPFNLAMTYGSARRIFKIFDEKEIVRNNKINNFKFSSLELKNVDFGYNKQNKIIQNLNLQIKENQIIGINGKSGVGKSTLLKLIMGMQNPTSGEILINNKIINDYTLKSIYSNINLFSQSTFLFNDTIWNNLTMWKKDISKQEVVEICKLVNIYEFIANTEKGFDSYINEYADNLSSGEKQRIGLARVLIMKPKLLLLDEATSNIDALNESYILKILKKLKNEMSIIIVSHRLSTLSICDHIYKFSNKKLELIEK